MLCQLSKFCFCMSLKTGSFMVGAWTLFTAALMISLQVINVLSLQYLTNSQIKHGGINVEYRKIFSWIEIILGFAQVATSCLLLFGVMKEKRKLLIPYAVGVSLYQIFDFSSLMFYIAKRTKMEPSIWLPDATMMCINVYCIIVVSSYYKEMKAKERWTRIVSLDSIE
ncbi:uncharacterized protein LOC124445840 [Xenia sp. Carnegie-2017]|uniref:uncharacterized protein LOC124445840 n=1 Tax=Xenia sp. Carnegie-2017 TaxID=2897299 RepID=UPI001F038EA9|nr:uncharacterized protein LOC124445840 [Xenia sp. Carnegie-2017]